jgi:hypothetical protein
VISCFFLTQVDKLLNALRTEVIYSILSLGFAKVFFLFLFAQVLIQTVHLYYATVCFRSCLCCIDEAGSVKEARIFVLIV